VVNADTDRKRCELLTSDLADRIFLDIFLDFKNIDDNDDDG